MNIAIDTNLKKWMWISASIVIIFVIGFSTTSGLLFHSFDALKNAFVSKIGECIFYHSTSFDREARHYFLLPEGGYNAAFYIKPLLFYTIAGLIFNALFNALFQPMFFCIFTPQVLLNLLLFPFFLYGAIKYFKKVPIMILVFFVVYIYVGLYGSVVEALIRHRMSCELIYLLIGVAGFTSLITEKLLS